jgi:hypothetical protein
VTEPREVQRSSQRNSQQVQAVAKKKIRDGHVAKCKPTCEVVVSMAPQSFNRSKCLSNGFQQVMSTIQDGRQVTHPSQLLNVLVAAAAAGDGWDCGNSPSC